MSPSIPSLNNRYRLRQQLGNNAGRQTWLAQDTNVTPPAPVIVKLLAFSPQMQWEELKLFEREAQVLKSLQHPHLPRYRDSFSIDSREEDGLHWFALVQDYIPGKSLQQLLDEGQRFSEKQMRFIAVRVLNILKVLHELDPPVLHRDIKPSNLILGNSNKGGSKKQVYLIDFGAVGDAKTVEGATFTVVGTAGYAPLEQFWGKAVAASDLYALGATLIHLATGISPSELPQDNLRIQFRDKVSLALQFVDWLEVLSDPNLERRFSSAQQALEALKTGLTAPLVVKPKSSRIQLKTSENSFLIEVPRSRTSTRKLGRLTLQFLSVSLLQIFVISLWLVFWAVLVRIFFNCVGFLLKLTLEEFSSFFDLVEAFLRIFLGIFLFFLLNKTIGLISLEIIHQFNQFKKDFMKYFSDRFIEVEKNNIYSIAVETKFFLKSKFKKSKHGFSKKSAIADEIETLLYNYSNPK